MKRVRFGEFMVHFNTECNCIEFAVYPIVTSYTPEGEHICYVDMSYSFEPLDEFDENKASTRFIGSFVWRGVWEGRIYFTDDEYWGDELKEMADLYENNIVPWCKEFIKKRDPSSRYDD